MASRLQVRRDLQANWTTNNPLMASGEIGLETDTDLVKFGDGLNQWNSLPYFNGDYFRLTANGAAIGATIADFFSGGSIQLGPSAAYEFEFDVAFLKTTAGTVTFTLTSGTAPVNLQAKYFGSPVGGVGTVGTAQFAGIVGSTSAAAALPPTGSLTTGANHSYIIRGIIETGALGHSFKLQCTESAGTITPLRGSTFRIKRLPYVNYSVFA